MRTLHLPRGHFIAILAATAATPSCHGIRPSFVASVRGTTQVVTVVYPTYRPSAETPDSVATTVGQHVQHLRTDVLDVLAAAGLVEQYQPNADFVRLEIHLEVRPWAGAYLRPPSAPGATGSAAYEYLATGGFFFGAVVMHAPNGETASRSFHFAIALADRWPKPLAADSPERIAAQSDWLVAGRRRICETIRTLLIAIYGTATARAPEAAHG